MPLQAFIPHRNDAVVYSVFEDACEENVLKNDPLFVFMSFHFANITIDEIDVKRIFDC